MSAVNVALDRTTSLKLDRMLDTLLEEFGGRIDQGRIEQLLADSLEQIMADATVLDFVPLFAYRATRDRCQSLQLTWDDPAGEGRRLRIAPAA